MITILLVENEPILLESLSEYLSFAGYKVIKAMDGQSAIALAFQNEYDLMIVDFELPDISGAQLWRTIRENGTFTNQCFIVYSEQPHGVVSAAFDFWPIKYVTKPFLVTMLLTLINECLG